MSQAVRQHREFLFSTVAMDYQEPITLVRGEGNCVWDDAVSLYDDGFLNIEY